MIAVVIIVEIGLGRVMMEVKVVLMAVERVTIVVGIGLRIVVIDVDGKEEAVEAVMAVVVIGSPEQIEVTRGASGMT